MLSYLQPDDPAELRELARSVRKFAESRFGGSEEESLQFKRGDFEAMAELGLTGIIIEEQFGGSALDMAALASCIFELARVQLGPAIYLSVHLMAAGLIQRWSENGTHRQLLEDLCTGKKLAAFCLTEAQAGSDAAALQLKAAREGGNYRLDGEKIYITSAGYADVYLVFARTGGSSSKGISAFLVDRDTPGISFGKPERKMGCEGSPIASVYFDSCMLPLSALLGKEGEGFKIALSGLDGGRVNIAAAACGLASRSIEIAAAHVSQRKQFGSVLSEFQGIQFMLADMVIKLRSAVELTRRAAAGISSGSRSNGLAAIAKCAATDAAMSITTDGVQLLGGAGYLKEYEVERLMRGAKMLQIVEGTNQIQRVLIARGLLGS